MTTTTFSLRLIPTLLLICLGSSSLPWATQAADPILRVSDNHRFLVRSDGSPFFYLGDTAWELFHRLTREEADTYLQDRADKGFTVIQAVALAELSGLTDPNAYGYLPLINNDPTQPDVNAGPDNDYWDQVDYVVNKAESLGLFIGFLPTWGTYWHDQAIFNTNNAQIYGQWLGQRYKDKPIIWILGGDRSIDTPAQLAVLRAMAQGLRAGDGGTHLITLHPGGNGAYAFAQTDPTLDFNLRENGHAAEYTGHYDATFADYNRTPAKPVIDGEPLYEDHPVSFNPTSLGHSLSADVRRPLYWELFGGAFGHTYGHHSIWQMYDPAKRSPVNSPLMPWYQAIHRPGSGEMQYARKLLESRPFLTRIPDDSVIVTDAVATSVPGAGRYRFSGTRDSSGSYALVYAPGGRDFSVQMSKITGGTVKAWWYDPRTGQATPIGLFPNTGQRLFSPPNSGEFMDWVLVLDDATQNFPPPGQPLPTAAAITRPPANLSVFAGQPATFQVQVSGSAPITFQWQQNKTDLPNATNSSYTLPVASLSDHLAAFRVRVSNFLIPAGVLSDSATLTVLSEDGHKISASFSETGSTTNLGNLAGNGIYASPDGYPAPSAKVPVGPFAPAANIAALDFGATASDVGGRALDFTNDFGNTLGVMDGLTLCGWLNCGRLGGGWGGNRIAFALASPSELGFDLAQQPTGTLRLGVNQTAAFGPASSAIVTQDPATDATNWVFFAVTYDGTRPANNLVYYSGSSTRAVTADTTNSYARGVIPASGQLTLGHFSAAFSARASTGTNSSAFRGLMDEIHVFNRVLALSEIQTQQNASAYQSVVPVAPSIVQHPQSQSVFSGTSASFAANASGTLPLSWQWWTRHIGVDAAIPGATNQTCTLGDAVTSDNGDQFWVVVTNAAGSASSQRALLTVLTQGSPKAWLSFYEGSGTVTTNLGYLAGMGAFVQNGSSFPVFSANVPAGPLAPASNKCSVDFGTIGATDGGRAIDFTNAFGNTLGTMNAFTLTGWLNCRDLTAGSGGNRILFALAAPDGAGFDLVQNANGSLQIGVNQWPDGTPAMSSSGKIAADPSAGSGNWVFFAVTYDGTKSSGNTTFSFGSPTLAAALDVTVTYNRGPIATSGSLTVGNFSTWGGSARGPTGPAGSRNFRGLLDEVRVFDRVLTPAEIQASQTALAAAIPSPRLAVATQGSQLALSWDSLASFQLQYRTNLVRGSWAGETNPPLVNGTLRTVTAPSSDPSRFYRLISRRPASSQPALPAGTHVWAFLPAASALP